MQAELTEFREAARRYGLAGLNEEKEAGDNVYHKQLKNIIDGDMRRLLSDIDACA